MAITNKGVTYPTSGDSIAPLETHFNQLADDADNVGVVSGAQTFTGPATTGATVDVTVAMPFTLSAAPKIVASVQGGTAASVYAITVLGAPTATSFTVRVFKLNGSTAETDLQIVWMASTYA
jgi:hypothetical protein